MCERTSAMFAIRACRVFCMKNFQSYPDQCGVPGEILVSIWYVWTVHFSILVKERPEQLLKWQIKWEKWSQSNTVKINMTKPFKNAWKCCRKLYFIQVIWFKLHDNHVTDQRYNNYQPYLLLYAIKQEINVSSF